MEIVATVGDEEVCNLCQTVFFKYCFVWVTSRYLLEFESKGIKITKWANTMSFNMLQQLQGLACGVPDDEWTDEISQEGQDPLPLAVLGHSKGTGQWHRLKFADVQNLLS